MLQLAGFIYLENEIFSAIKWSLQKYQIQKYLEVI